MVSPMPEFKIDRDTIYTKDALISHLEGIVNIDVFLRRLQPRHVLKNAWLGSDILTALERSSGMGEDETETQGAPTYSKIGGRRRGKSPEIPMEKILIKK